MQSFSPGALSISETISPGSKTVEEDYWEGASSTPSSSIRSIGRNTRAAPCPLFTTSLARVLDSGESLPKVPTLA
jgi:hypothetical protein